MMMIKTTRVVLVASCLAWAAAASAQTADELIEKTLTATGGRAAFAKITSRTTTGTMTLSTPAGDVSGPIEVLNAAPNKSRTLITLDLSSLGAGQLVIDQRFDGTSGYATDSMRGDRDITGSQLENMKNSTFPNPFLSYKDRGTTIETGGKEKAGDRDAYVLIITPKSGPVVREWVDAETYLPLKISLKVEVPEMGEVEQTTTYADYHDVDGIKIPFKLVSTSSVQSFNVVVTKVEHNTKIDPALFSKPGGK